MSRRALKGINWSAFAERLTEADKTMYATFKSKSDQYLQRVMSHSAEPMKIDWAYYKQNIPIAGMVDKFQKEYESLKIPYPSDNYTQIIEAEEKQTMSEVQKFLDESNSLIAEYQTELDKIRNILPFDQMTLEDFAEAYPESANNIDTPTIWPHDPNEQPGDEPEPIPKPEH